MNKAKNSGKGCSIVQNNLWLLRKIWKYTPSYVIWMIVEGVVWGINNSIGIIYTRTLLDALGNGEPLGRVMTVVVSYIVYMILFYVFDSWYWKIFNSRARERLHVALNRDLFSHALELDLAKYDDPAFYNEFVWSMNQCHTHAVGLIEDTGKLINRIVASTTLISVLFSVDSLIAVVILGIAAAQIFCQRYKNKLNLQFSEQSNPVDRKMGYVNRVYKMAEYAKELRTTRVGDALMRELDDGIAEKMQIHRRFAGRRITVGMVSALISTAGDGIPLVMVLYKVMVSGTLGLGGFAVAVNALWTMSWLLGDMVSRIMKYHEHGIYIEKIHRFLETESELHKGCVTAPDFETLSVRGLTFRYPGKEDAPAVLCDVDMDIRRGEKIAIVGYNGAGKTTLTKLLMHLYDPTMGEILYNGAPIHTYETASLRRHLSAVFQNHRIFAATVAENVAGGCYTPEREGDVREALHKSTFTEKLASLSCGLDTVLTREFDPSGTQLSGGETQKIAIARAFYKNADLIILDEPSSALDPDAEYALNRAIASYAAEKTIVFISHRLSTTRHADRIYMFDSGRVIESGTHEELMQMEGKYAFMFNLQAKEYRKTQGINV